MKEKTLFVIMLVNIIVTLVLVIGILTLNFIHKSSSEVIRKRIHCSSATCPVEKCDGKWCDCYYCEDEKCDETQNVKCESEKVITGDQ